jgi:type III restriction enzyme
MARRDYAIQGWRKHRIYPDFIVSDAVADRSDYAKVYVVETKGVHLKNEDTNYKRNVFTLCNKLAEERSWTELGLEFPNKKIRFEVVFEDEWQKKLNALFAN